MKRTPIQFDAALLAAILATMLQGCEARQTAPAASPIAPQGAEPASFTSLGDVIESVEDWSFGAARGQIVRTQHYRVFTTETQPLLVGRLPNFLERALEHYRTAITPLPAPPIKLDTYLMDNRPQWVRLAQQLLGPESEHLTRIQRGGFATRGVGVFYDIGVFDTLAVAAHEGWHQYAQRTLRERLPIWLEEGIATFMEGHKWDGAEPAFLPWANVERFDQLRKAHAAGRVLALPDLLSTSPLDAGPSADALVDYYAQVWVLVHFLMEADDGAHRPAMRAVLDDAANGRLNRTLLVRIGRTDAARAISTARGDGVLRAYIAAPMDSLAASYASFIDRIVAVGSRDRIVAGRSPLSAP